MRPSSKERRQLDRTRIIDNRSWPSVAVQTIKECRSFDVMGLLTRHNMRGAASKYKENKVLYAQGDSAYSVFYIYNGKIKITVGFRLEKEAIVAVRGPDEFCGEGAMTGTALRLATATITGHSLRDVRSILDAHYLNRDQSSRRERHS